MPRVTWQQIVFLAMMLLAFNLLYVSSGPRREQGPVAISYSRFKTELSSGNVLEVSFTDNLIRGKFSHTVVVSTHGTEGKPFTEFETALPPYADASLSGLLDSNQVNVIVSPPPQVSTWMTLLVSMLPWLLIIGVWWFILKGMRGRNSPGGMMGNFSKSGAKLYSLEESKVTFADVAGLEEAKQDLTEIVEYLRNPSKYTKLGGKVPCGLLLVGPPGTGKTLMARAVAGEAKVPFYSISASQFIEMFVGVGASRVRDLFSSAKKNAPSIVFIDELDAVGRSRGTGLGGGNDEREQTLNQLLSELDGFDPHSEVIVMAATNRPDVLDAALLRPGRFDRQVMVDRPDWRARSKILQVHCRKVPLGTDVDLEIIARGTPGMCGADLESLVNEAAMIAARENRKDVSMDCFERAKDRILMGSERKLFLTEEEKRITAYHEAGHTLVAALTPGADPIHKVTIIPRGQALGVTQQLPHDDRYHYRRSFLLARIAVALGGRAAEKQVFGEISTGAQSDLKLVGDLAEKMVCQWGMSDRLGPLTFSRGEEHPFLGRKLAADKSFSEHTGWIIDQEIEKLIRDGERQADELLADYRGALDSLALALLDEEVLGYERVVALLVDAGIQPTEIEPALEIKGES